MDSMHRMLEEAVNGTGSSPELEVSLAAAWLTCTCVCSHRVCVDAPRGLPRSAFTARAMGYRCYYINTAPPGYPLHASKPDHDERQQAYPSSAGSLELELNNSRENIVWSP